jgi:hypothetical protein
VASVYPLVIFPQLSHHHNLVTSPKNRAYSSVLSPYSLLWLLFPRVGHEQWIVVPIFC